MPNGHSVNWAAKEGANPAGHPHHDTDAKEVIRSIYDIDDPALADEFVTRLATDLQDHTFPPEVRSLGRTLTRWKDQIVAWHRGQVTNGPTEAANNLIPVLRWRSPAEGDGLLMVGDRAEV